MSYAIGIDLGGSSVKALAIAPSGEIVERVNVDFDREVPMEWAEKIRTVIESMVKEQRNSPRAIGLSAPGLAAKDGKSIAYMPGRLEGLEGLNWSEYLRVNQPVPVLNDGHAALVGEAWLGAGKGFADVIMLTLGTGVGGAAIVDGKLLRGHIGRAGHIGHLSLNPEGAPDICGAPGSLELAIGNCTIEQRTAGRFATTHDLIKAYAQGDAEAVRAWRKSVKDLAAGIASCINILDPEAVIIGGGIARAGRALFEPLEEYLRPMEWQPGGHQARLLPAELGEFAGAIGAAYNGICGAMAVEDYAEWKIERVPYVQW